MTDHAAWTRAQMRLRRNQRILAASLVALLIGLVGIGAMSYGASQESESSEKRIASLESRNDLSEQKVGALADQVIRTGQVPVAVPADPSDEGKTSITQEQANLAYASYCDTYPDRCQAENGAEGQPGAGLTSADALLAVQTYCADGNCEPQVTPQDLLRAVTRSCTTGRVVCTGAQGPAGATGRTGDRGEQGRGVVGVVCASGGFVVSFSDGTSAGPMGDCVAEDGTDGRPGEQGLPGIQGEQGIPGTSGIVNVTTDPACSGMVVANVRLEYDAETMTLSLLCS